MTSKSMLYVVEIEWCWRCSLKWNYNENFHDSISLWVDMFNIVVGVCRIVFQFSSQQNEEQQQRQLTWAHFQFHLVNYDTKQHNITRWCFAVWWQQSKVLKRSRTAIFPFHVTILTLITLKSSYHTQTACVLWNFSWKICHATSK